MPHEKRIYFWFFVVALLLVVALPGLSAASSGYLTPEPPYITLDPAAPAGSSVLAIINSGDTLGGFRFEGLPDGIGLAPGAAPHTVDVYVAHEQTTVPFFGTADFENASVSKVTLSTTSGPMMGAVLAGETVVSPDDGYLRFCSAFMAGPAEGFENYTFFTGEDANEIVDVSQGSPFGPDHAVWPQRQAGYVVAYDTVTGESRPIPGMGRLNHENTVVIPGGWHRTAILTTDDTFDGPSAQLYLYLAGSDQAVMDDKGGLWAFRVTRTGAGRVNPNDPFNGANDYLDLQVGDDWQGEFIRVPKEIALGRTADPPQLALEKWSNENNVFQFIRLEDLATDRHNPRVVYIADTGRSRVVPDPNTGRLVRGPGGTVGFADNGRIFRLEFNENNPRKVISFSVMAQGDDPNGGRFVPFVSPDNMDTSVHSLMVQEDADNAKIWRYDFASGSWSVAATVNDPDGESSGIVDASAWFGEGTWLLDVQGHGLYVDQELLPDGTLLKRESGQLILMKIPGS